MKNKKIIFFCIVISLCINLHSHAADTLKIMSYNILNYGSDGSRNEYFKSIISPSKPDILVVQEITSQAAVNNFLNNVLNIVFPGEYAAGVFINGTDTDNAIFYKISKIRFIANRPIGTALRDINEFILLPIDCTDTLRIYSVHLKASNTSSDRVKRAAEVDSLRKVTNALANGSYFMVLGDFNIYGSHETAYQKLIEEQSGNDGHFCDPISMNGTWNNSSFSNYHTQSPRTRSFGGGATGGMDDRFDMILFSSAVRDDVGITYIEGSTIAFGNDGNHFNDSINKMPNSIVAQDIANALHYASDHLPVYALFAYETGASSISGNISHTAGDYVLYQNYPNPFNPVTNIGFHIPATGFVTLEVFDITGREVAVLVNGKLSQGEYTIPFFSRELKSGVYFYKLVAGEFIETRKMILLK